VFDELGFPPVTDEEVELAATCLDSRDLPDRDRAGDVVAGDRVLAEGISGLDVARILSRRGFCDVAAAVFDMQRQRVAADYLQTAAIIEPDGTVVSAVNDANDYRGPGTGYRLEGARWERLRRLPHAIDARLLGAAAVAEPQLRELGEAPPLEAPDDVVVAVGPAFAGALGETIGGLAHADVLGAVVEGIREAGGTPRIVRVRRSADVAFIGHDGACLAGSRIAVGLQSKGTALIHRADLQPLDNLELFGMAPLLTLDSYRQIGINAAGYALGRPVAPVPTMLDNYARAKLIVRTTLLHAREAAEVVRGAPAVEVELAAEPARA
jgi:dehydratase large subunit/dehydratase medium subunit